MTERWPASRKYRDLFEVVKKSVIEAIEEGKHIPRMPVTSMKNDMQAPLHSLDIDITMESVTDDLQQMISDMTGENISIWYDKNMEMDETETLPGELGDEPKKTGQLGWMSTDEVFWYNNEYPPGPYDTIGA